MWWLSLTMTADAGCRGAVVAVGRAWSELAVPVSTGPDVVELDGTAGTLADHGDVAEDLAAARPRRGRGRLPAAIAGAEAWLASNEDALGVAEVRAAIAAARGACGLPS